MTVPQSGQRVGTASATAVPVPATAARLLSSPQPINVVCESPCLSLRLFGCLPASLCCEIDRLQEHVSIFGPQQFVGSTVLPDVSALFGAADAARPKDLSSFVAQCLEEPGSLAMNTNAGANPGAEQQLTKLQARFRGESTIAYRHRETDR